MNTPQQPPEDVEKPTTEEPPAVESGEDHSGGGLSALDKLKAKRRIEREKESEDLERRRETAGYISAGPALPLYKRITIKAYIIMGGIFVILIILLNIGLLIYRSIQPSMELDSYREMLEEGNYEQSSQHLSTYLGLKPTDWDITAEGGELHLLLGNTETARILFKRLQNSPLSSDTDIQFLSAVASLPSLKQVNTQVTEILTLLDSHVPSLLVSALIETTQNPEESARLYEQALSVLERMNQSNPTYQRYQSLIGIFLVSVCREVPTVFDNLVQIPFASFPATPNLERELLVYGMNPYIQTNFCGLISHDIRWVQSFAPNLIAFTTFLQGYTALLNDDITTANIAISRSISEEYLPLTSYINGTLLMFNGEYDAAVTAYQRSGRLDDPNVRLNLAAALMLKGSSDSTALEDADREYTAMIAADSNNVVALTNRAVVAMMQERDSAANNDINEALTIDNTDLYANYNLAVLSFIQGDYRSAITQFTNMHGVSNDIPGLLYYRAQSFINANNDFERALNDFRRNLNVGFGYSVLSYIGMGDYYASQGDLSAELAIQHYRDAYDLNPNYIDAAIKYAAYNSVIAEDVTTALEFYDGLQEQFASLEGEPKKRFDEFFSAERARILYEAGLPTAEEALREVVQTISDETLRIESSILLVNLVLNKKGRLSDEETREVLDITRIILPIDPKNPVLLALRARALAVANDLDQATTFIDSALNIEPNNPSALSVKAEIYALDQRWDEAVEYYKRAFEVDARSTEPLSHAIAILEKHNNNPEELKKLVLVKNAIEEERKARAQAFKVDGYADNAELKVGIVQPVQSEDERREVGIQIKNLRELLERNQVEPFSAYINLGALYSRLENNEEAIRYMKLAASVPNIPAHEAYKPHLNISQLLVLQDKFQEADEAITRVIELDPPDISRYYYLRAGIRERIDHLLAIDDYDEFLALKPNSYRGYFRRGLNKLSLGDAQGAIADLSQAIRIDPQQIDAYRARRSAFGRIGDRQGAAKDAEIINVLAAKGS